MQKIFVYCLLLLTGFSTFANEHPGGMHTRAQINRVRKMIDAKTEPVYSAYLQMIGKADSVANANHHAKEDLNVPGYYVNAQEHRANSLSIQTDGFAAYASALAWQLTNQKKYAERALYYLNAWASVNKKYSDADGALVLSYSGTSMVIAAELMYHYKNWKPADKTAFKGWVTNVYRKATNEIRNRKNNWADWGRLGSMLSDYFLDDVTDMAENIRLVKSDLFHKIAVDGHMPEEVRREKNGIWYTYFSLAPITAACWVAYNATGENLFNYTEGDKSIKKALDYLSYYQAHPAEWKWFKDPNLASPRSATGFWPANLFEAMYGIYKDENYLGIVVANRPLIYDKHHFAWSFPTLMPVSLSFKP